MREIKFRAWVDFNDEFVYLNEFGDFDGKYESFSWEYIQALETMEQFTGLYDKNGKEIYKGDIILNPLYEEPYIVEYSENLAGYAGWGDDRACGCYLITDEDIEIIGNIHENPELIK